MALGSTHIALGWSSSHRVQSTAGHGRTSPLHMGRVAGPRLPWTLRGRQAMLLLMEKQRDKGFVGSAHEEDLPLLSLSST